jgi:hypothetical protein
MWKRNLLRSLVKDRSAVAMIEFAYSLPVFLLVATTGAEITHYATTRMRLSQVALHVADHAARMGSGSLLAAKTISEAQINDILTGAGLQAGDLDLYTNGRVILSNLEPMASPNTADRYRITWQRCRGSLARTSTYGATGDVNMTGIGPTGRQVKAADGGATMFVEIRYQYQPLLAARLAPSMEIRQIASMMVRDRRDLSQIYNSEAVAPSNCT